jgi:hypothetical protein
VSEPAAPAARKVILLYVTRKKSPAAQPLPPPGNLRTEEFVKPSISKSRARQGKDAIRADRSGGECGGPSERTDGQESLACITGRENLSGYF